MLCLVFCRLTHYYCILYAVLVFVTYLIFPAMIKHIFFGARGREVMGNAVAVSDLFSKIKIDYMLLIVPTVMYFLVVSKITVYRVDRYMFPVYTNIFLLCVCY